MDFSLHNVDEQDWLKMVKSMCGHLETILKEMKDMLSQEYKRKFKYARGC